MDRTACTEPQCLYKDAFFKGLEGVGVDRGSSVGITTDYGLDGPGSNPGGDEIFRTCPDRPWGPPSLLYDGYRVFPKGKVRAGACC